MGRHQNPVGCTAFLLQVTHSASLLLPSKKLATVRHGLHELEVRRVHSPQAEPTIESSVTPMAPDSLKPSACAMSSSTLASTSSPRESDTAKPDVSALRVRFSLEPGAESDTPSEPIVVAPEGEYVIATPIPVITPRRSRVPCKSSIKLTLRNVSALHDVTKGSARVRDKSLRNAYVRSRQTKCTFHSA